MSTPTDANKKTYVLALVAATILVGLIAFWVKDRPPQTANGFSGARAMQHVEALVGFGPRPAGSQALEESRQYIERELATSGWTVERQAFTKTTALKGKVQFVNLRARYSPGATDIAWDDGGGMVVVASHYDTKWYADFEFLGANDSGSSTGALIEMARVLAQDDPDMATKIELVFFDGEEAFGENITDIDGLYGSHYYARALWRPKPAGQKPSLGILLDMIGDRDLVVTPPTNSDPELVRLTLDVAEELGYGAHFEPGTIAITDDHVPLMLEARFPAIDLIDFEYGGAWHTRHDTLDRLSPESLEIVGQVTVEMLRRLLE